MICKGLKNSLRNMCELEAEPGRYHLRVTNDSGFRQDLIQPDTKPTVHDPEGTRLKIDEN